MAETVRNFHVQALEKTLLAFCLGTIKLDALVASQCGVS